MDDHEPNTVKDLLVELKDASELMVDLAYAAVFFNEEKLAEEVGRLEERSTLYLRRLRTIAMLAARSPEDAEGMAGVLWIADAIQKVGDAASDIARVIAARLGIPDALRPDLRHADEMTELAEAAVALAYASILFNNRTLAAEVGVLEARSDVLEDELESWVLRAAPEARNVDELRGLIRLASASESICDAARDMTWYVEHGEPLHPVVQMA